MKYHLPCAGITLVRFYGFDLSPIREDRYYRPSRRSSTPRNLKISHLGK